MQALYKHFVTVTIDKSEKFFAFIYKKDYISKFLIEVGISNLKS